MATWQLTCLKKKRRDFGIKNPVSLDNNKSRVSKLQYRYWWTQKPSDQFRWASRPPHNQTDMPNIHTFIFSHQILPSPGTSTSTCLHQSVTVHPLPNIHLSLPTYIGDTKIANTVLNTHTLNDITTLTTNNVDNQLLFCQILLPSPLSLQTCKGYSFFYRVVFFSLLWCCFFIYYLFFNIIN